jgi:hypothetical protein
VGEDTDPARPQGVAGRPGVAAARAEVLAARGVVSEELMRLEASARAAADIPAKVRRNPTKSAGIAAGAGFLLVGGPAKLFRRARRAVVGPSEPLPKSMLPKEIDKALNKLGTDGDRVRGTLEREFAAYLEATAPQRKERDLRGVAALTILPVLRPLAMRVGKQLVEQAFAPGNPAFEEQLAKIRERTSAALDRRPADGATPAEGVARESR